SDPANYRPISLTSNVIKVMGKLVRESLIKFQESNRLITIHQHGFRSKRSTVTQLLECVNDWTSFVDQGQSVDVVYLDFAKAFDTVSHPKLLFKLKRLGIDGELLKWIENFLTGRKQIVRVSNTLSNEAEVRSGVPQGIVLGPVLFIVYINDLVSMVKNSSLKIYADDVKLYVRSDISANRHLLAADLNRIHRWALDWQLQLSVSKCQVLTIGVTNENFLYTVDDIALANLYSLRDLGIILNSKLDYSQHCHHLYKVASAISMNIFRYFKCRNRDFLIKMFKTYVRSKLESSIVIWSSYLKKNIELIEKVQRRFTKRIPGLSNYSYEERLNILNLDTLQHRRIIFDLSLLHKIVHKTVDVQFSSLFEFAKNSRITRTSSKRNLKHPRCQKKIRENFFAVRVVKYWNLLDSDSQFETGFNRFRRKIIKLLPEISKYLS
ncbi:MAG: reverse transcriptase family protein, partial [Cyanobacteria bacterium P01_A01_bin.84]